MLEDKSFYVSVIIPAYNASATVCDCLSVLMKQTFAEPYEVIVVDDGSTDSTPDVISKEFPRVRLLRQKNAGPAAARNKGAIEAKGDLVFFTDADCRPMPDWLEQMAKPFVSNPDVVGVKGIYRTEQSEITARFVQMEYEDKYDLMRKEEYIDFIDTYSAGFRKEIFNSMGGYDTSFPVACSEDAEFSFRLANKGYKMVFNPNAVVYHIHPDMFTAYVKKKFKFAYWRMLAVKKNPNKLVRDSHTPQIMKIQLLLAPVVVVFMLGAPFCDYSRVLFIGSAGLYLILSLPFIIKTVLKDVVVGLTSPVFLFARSLAQFLGVIRGLVDIFLLKKYG